MEFLPPCSPILNSKRAVPLGRMDPARSPSSVGGAGEGLDLCLSGSQLAVLRRPSSASPGKPFSRSVSVTVTGDGRAKRNTPAQVGLGSSLSIKNLRRSNSTTQVNQRVDTSGRGEDFLFDSSLDGRRKLASLNKTSPDRTTWNILDDQSRVSLPLSRGVSPSGPRRRGAGVALANNRSNKGAVGNAVTTILHNNHSDQPLTPKSSNQKPSFNNIIKATAHEDGWVESGSLTKSQKNFSSCSSTSNTNATCSPAPSPAQARSPAPSPAQPRRHEVTEEEAERFIQQVNHAVVSIQRWYRRHANRQRTGEAALKRLLTVKTREREQRGQEVMSPETQKKKTEDRKRVREEKARAARLAAIEELQQKRAQRAGQVQRLRTSRPRTQTPVWLLIWTRSRTCGQGPPQPHGATQEVQGRVSVEGHQQGALCSRPHSKTTLTDLLDTLKLLEAEPEPKSYSKDKYAWIDEEGGSPSLTADNLQRHGQLSQIPALPEGGALLSQAKLHSIMSFLDEMEQSEQERPHSTAGSHREVLQSEEEVGVALAGGAQAQQRELSVRHVKETEKELSRNLQLQKEQYESTIERHLTFIDQLIDDKKALSEHCEAVVNELKQVDHKYTKKITHMQEQHDLVWHILGPLCEEIKKLKQLMGASEKIRREKWIDEKTRKIKEITVKGLEPEIQKLISKQKAELKKLRVLHEAELLQADERAGLRYVQQTEELRLQLEREREQHCQREREQVQQRFEQQLQEEQKALQQQRRRLYQEVSEEKERLSQLASRQREELDELRRQLEENSSVAGRALRLELDKSREEQERRHQAEMKALRERLEIEKQTWEENYMKKEEAWLLGREREMKEEVRCGRDREIELVIHRLEEETSGMREECERAAENRVKRVREQYETELKDLEESQRALQDRHTALKQRQGDTEAQLLHVQMLLRHKEQELQDLTQIRDQMSEERRCLADVIRTEFAERLVQTEEESRRMKVEVSELRVRLRVDLERVTRQKEEELAEVHHRVKAAILKKEETVSALRKQHEAALKRADHLEGLLEQQRKQLLGK
ncbi:hypothetical protein AAFF_G00254900 [Aldrovandia affinis]|uniref:5-azacytidine-induced protein 1 n=1 Tax=Aldrovandia affinis TaxID=143900 RepID=A0AAD7W2V7_9TELE|nr:hypothetical protein AAFF_G00254900 [Aldrovandia affinis]